MRVGFAGGQPCGGLINRSVVVMNGIGVHDHVVPASGARRGDRVELQVLRTARPARAAKIVVIGWIGHHAVKIIRIQHGPALHVVSKSAGSVAESEAAVPFAATVGQAVVVVPPLVVAQVWKFPLLKDSAALALGAKRKSPTAQQKTQAKGPVLVLLREQII